MTDSATKCTELYLCKRGKGVLILGSSGRVVFSGFEFCVNSVDFTSCQFV